MRELTELQRKCAALLPDMELRFDEPMSNHTSFRIGGGAEIMAFPKTREELADIRKCPLYWTVTVLSWGQEPMYWPRTGDCLAW